MNISLFCFPFDTIKTPKTLPNLPSTKKTTQTLLQIFFLFYRPRLFNNFFASSKISIMANSRILFSIIAFFLFINTSIYAKSIAVLDEEDQDEFLDPIVEKRRLSNIIEEMAGDDKRIISTNWAMLFIVIGVPIGVILLIVLTIVSLKGSGAYTVCLGC
ncbi:unnamed protein product [Meloidogyne enterolobii]|uniref:Uncharacterized protein n=2 Tax=Meloidogyne enterolobii TaxID=390850 RepID=A0ACB0XTH3_MELEN